MLLPSPEATEELPMNPFRAVRHPPRRPQHFQQNAFHEGKGWVSMLPRHSIVQRASVPAWAVIDKCADLPQMCCWGDFCMMYYFCKGEHVQQDLVMLE